jgi:predicted metal-dependent hydrolase
VGEREVVLEFVRHAKARRYILRLRPDGVARVTVPRGGSIAAAFDFARRHGGWIEQQLAKPQPAAGGDWAEGTEIMYRGEMHALRAGSVDGVIRFADQQIQLGATNELRPGVERHLRNLAARELPARTHELAGQHGVSIQRVTVRDQRTRWGSCSVRGTISLNWRLIQVPPFVRDYILLHELMHRRELNHSARFWAHVAAVCPAWREAERWLRQNGRRVRG